MRGISTIASMIPFGAGGILAVLCLAGECPAQTVTIEKRLAQAQELAKNGPSEDAAIELRRLLGEVRALSDAGTRRRFEKAATKLLRSTDPLTADRDKACLKAAQLLLKPAGDYLRLKWLQTAREIALGIEAFAPGKAAKLLVKIEKALATDGLAPSAGMIGKFFRGGENATGVGTWEVGDDEAISPPIEEKTAILASRRKLGSRYRLRIQFLVTPENNGKAGVIVAYKNNQDYFVVELDHVRGGTYIGFLKYDSPRLKVVKERMEYFPRDERATWITLEIELKGDQAAVRANDFKPLEVQLTGEDLSGAIGLFISGDKQSQEPVRYRNLGIELL